MELLPLDPEIKLTFNQPMDTESVESNFSFSGTEGKVNGKISWNKGETEMTFVPDNLLGRNVGYILNLSATRKIERGLILGADYGAVFNTYDNFAVRDTKTDFGVITFTFFSPLAKANYKNLVSVFPAIDNLDAQVSEDGLSLVLYGDFIPDTNYTLEVSARLKDRWGQPLGDAFVLETRTPPLPSMLNVPFFGSTMAFVRPDEPVLYAQAANIQNVSTTVAPLSLQDFFSLQNSYDNQQAYAPSNSSTYSQTFELPPGDRSEVKLGLTQSNNQLLPGLYYVNLSSPQLEVFKEYLFGGIQSGKPDVQTWGNGSIGLGSGPAFANAGCQCARYDLR